jgi:hypothetical protein
MPSFKIGIGGSSFLSPQTKIYRLMKDGKLRGAKVSSFLRENPQKSLVAEPTIEWSMAKTSANILYTVEAPFLLIV